MNVVLTQGTTQSTQFSSPYALCSKTCLLKERQSIVSDSLCVCVCLCYLEKGYDEKKIRMVIYHIIHVSAHDILLDEMCSGFCNAQIKKKPICLFKFRKSFARSVIWSVKYVGSIVWSFPLIIRMNWPKNHQGRYAWISTGLNWKFLIIPTSFISISISISICQTGHFVANRLKIDNFPLFFHFVLMFVFHYSVWVSAIHLNLNNWPRLNC